MSSSVLKRDRRNTSQALPKARIHVKTEISSTSSPSSPSVEPSTPPPRPVKLILQETPGSTGDDTTSGSAKGISRQRRHDSGITSSPQSRLVRRSSSIRKAYNRLFGGPLDQETGDGAKSEHKAQRPYERAVERGEQLADHATTDELSHLQQLVAKYEGELDEMNKTILLQDGLLVKLEAQAKEAKRSKGVSTSSDLPSNAIGSGIVVGESFVDDKTPRLDILRKQSLRITELEEEVSKSHQALDQSTVSLQKYEKKIKTLRKELHGYRQATTTEPATVMIDTESPSPQSINERRANKALKAQLDEIEGRYTKLRSTMEKANQQHAVELGEKLRQLHESRRQCEKISMEHDETKRSLADLTTRMSFTSSTDPAGLASASTSITNRSPTTIDHELENRLLNAEAEAEKYHRQYEQALAALKHVSVNAADSKELTRRQGEQLDFANRQIEQLSNEIKLASSRTTDSDLLAPPKTLQSVSIASESSSETKEQLEQRNAAQEKLKRLQDELTKLREEASHYQEIHAQNQHLQQRNAMVEADLRSLIQERDGMQRELSSLSKARTQLQSTQQRVQDLERQHEEYSEVRNGLATEVNRHTATKQELQEAVATMDDLLRRQKSTQADLDIAIQRAEDLEGITSSRDRAIEELTRKLEMHTEGARNQIPAKDLQAAKTKILELQMRLEEVDGSRADMELALLHAEDSRRQLDEFQGYKRELDLANIRIGELQRSIEEHDIARGDVELMRQHATDLQKKVNSHKGMEQDLIATKARLIELEGVVKAAKKEQVQRRDDFAAEIQAHYEVKQELLETQARLEQLDKDLKANASGDIAAKESLKTAEQALVAAKSDNSRISEALLQKEAEVEAANAKLVSLRQAVEAAETQSAMHLQLHQENTKDLSAAAAKAKALTEKLAVKEADVAAANRSLEETKAALAAELARSAEHTHLGQSHAESLREVTLEKENKTKELQLRDKEIADLQQQVTQQRAQAESILVNFERAEGEVTNTRAEQVRLKKALDASSSEAEELRRQIDEQKAELGAALTRIDEVSRKEQAASAEQLQHSQAHEARLSEIEALKKAVAHLKTEASEATARFERAEGMSGTVQAERDMLQHSLSRAQEELSAAQAEAQRTSAMLASNDIELERTRSSLQELKVQAKDAESKENDNEQLQRSYRELNERFDSTSKALEEHKSTASAERERLLAQLGPLQTLEGEHRSLKEDFAAKETALSEVQVLLHEAKAAVTKHQSRAVAFDEIKERNEILEKELRAARTSLQSAEKASEEHQSTKAIMDSTQQQNENLRNELARTKTLLEEAEFAGKQERVHAAELSEVQQRNDALLEELLLTQNLLQAAKEASNAHEARAAAFIEAQEQTQSLEKELMLLRSELENHKSQAESERAVSQARTDEHEEISKQLASLQQENFSAVNRLIAVEGDLEKLTQQKVDQQNEFKEKLRGLQDVIDKLAALQEQKDVLEGRLLAAEAALEKNEEEFSSEREALQANTTAFESLSEQVDILSEELEVSHETEAELRALLEDTQAELDKLRASQGDPNGLGINFRDENNQTCDADPYERPISALDSQHPTPALASIPEEDSESDESVSTTGDAKPFGAAGLSKQPFESPNEGEEKQYSSPTASIRSVRFSESEELIPTDFHWKPEPKEVRVASPSTLSDRSDEKLDPLPPQCAASEAKTLLEDNEKKATHAHTGPPIEGPRPPKTEKGPAQAEAKRSNTPESGGSRSWPAPRLGSLMRTIPMGAPANPPS